MPVIRTVVVSTLSTCIVPTSFQDNQGSNMSNINSLYSGGLNLQNSIGFLKSNQGSSLIGSNTETKATDLSSIFVSAKSEQITPRLAPPPQTAVGRGRGRGNQGHPRGPPMSRPTILNGGTL
uniref:Uncharacterized protein n=1 Tax=Nelumbo nucifera TaxID=4432 RepID=A0A822YV78_NELNU|nr:TPA_asm: hypothetical protein HUJ06_008605 [Nelumbo nucifera]